MPLPVTKQELADWILRRLGAPVINIEITDVQLEDVIDEAVQLFQEWHYDGAERAYRVIKIEGDVLDGNNRAAHDLNAPLYDLDLIDSYRKGDRVMTLKTNGTPDCIWVRYDSEEKVNYVKYEFDSEGTHFVYYKDLNIADFYMLNMLSNDSDPDARDHVDSDGVFQLFDSDIHYEFTYTLDSEGFWTDSDSDWVLYDSDVHREWIYDSDDNGVWVWVDSDGGKYVPYDSDLHTYVGYYEDSEGNLVDSDGTLVAYDSDTYTVVVYDSDDSGMWVDSDGTWVLYDSDKYSIIAFDSDGSILDSDGNIFRTSYLDSDGGVYRLYVDSEGDFVQFDSDKHSGLFYESDGLGNYTNFTRNLDKLFYKYTTTKLVQRFSRVSIQPRRYSYDTAAKPHFFSRVIDWNRYSRESFIAGMRVTQSWDSDLYRNALEDYTWDDLWKKEDLVLNEPVVDYDYSKVGQVGIPVPENIIGINKVFRIDNFSGIGMWNYEYQYFLNNFDFFYGNSGSSTMPMTNYYITKSYIDMIDNLMNLQPAIRFSKHRNRLYIDTNWKRMESMAKNNDYYLMAECYEVNDPEVFGDVYKDKWLKRYATALAKMQWGSNLKKYSNTSMPGGLTLDGQALYDEGKEEAQALEDELKGSQLEMDFIIG